MAEKKEETGFKVTDRRLFTTEGEPRPDAVEEPSPAPPVPTAEPATPPLPVAESSPTAGADSPPPPTAADLDNGEYFALYHRINARSVYGCPSRSINSLAMSPLSRSCVTHAINRIK